VHKTTDKTCISFVKKRLDQDWGPIDEFNLFVENQAFDGTPVFIHDRDYPELREMKKHAADEEIRKAAEEAANAGANTALPPDTEMNLGSGMTLSSSEKECPVCTYINHKSRRSCEICETPF